MSSTSTATTVVDASDKRVILVVGGNKGIGYETVKQLAQRLPSATILLGTRHARQRQHSHPAHADGGQRYSL